MIGVIVNTAAVIIGSSIGLLAKKGIPDKYTKAIMIGIGFCTLYIGTTNMLKGSMVIVTTLSVVLGIIIGEVLDLDGRLNRLASRIENKFKKKDDEASMSEAFITASLLFCIGALTIVGSLQAGLTGDNSMLFTKSTLDFVSAIILTASLGIGVMFSAGFVLVFQGAIVLLSSLLAPVLSDAVVSEMCCVGGLLIIALGFSLIGIIKVKVINYTPAIFIPIGLVPLSEWLGSVISLF